jgi:hypothetical protein
VIDNDLKTLDRYRLQGFYFSSFRQNTQSFWFSKKYQDREIVVSTELFVVVTALEFAEPVFFSGQFSPLTRESFEGNCSEPKNYSSPDTRPELLLSD